MDGKVAFSSLQADLSKHVISTEVGTISDFVPGSCFAPTMLKYDPYVLRAANPGIDWAYFRFSTWTECVPVDIGDGKYEVVVLVRTRAWQGRSAPLNTPTAVASGLSLEPHQHQA